MSEESVSDEVITQLGVIREEGHCNMFDRGCVYDVAQQIGFDELVEFLEDADSVEYMDALQEMGRRA